jgi:hypothetical protein
MKINIALIGQGFMGRSHSDARGQFGKSSDPPTLVMHTAFDQLEENPKAFANNLDWENESAEWKRLVRASGIGLVDALTLDCMRISVSKAALVGSALRGGFEGHNKSWKGVTRCRGRSCYANAAHRRFRASAERGHSLSQRMVH